MLHKLEIWTVGELAKSDPKLLELHLKSHGRTLWEFANGIDHEKLLEGTWKIKELGFTTLAKDAVTEEEAKKRS